MPAIKITPLLGALLALLTVSLPTFAVAESSFADRFEVAWRLVDERYFQIERTGVDWAEVRVEYEPSAVNAASEEEFYDLLTRMYEELADDHSVFIPPDKVAELTETYGQLPCVAYFATSELPPTLISYATAPTLTNEQKVANVTFGLTPQQVGYLRVPDLASAGVAIAVRRAVNELQDGGAFALMLDLRGNPGGRLVTMMEVAGVFTSGLLWRAVTTWSLPLPYPAIGTVATDLPLAVLIDGDVNSAAEGLAGALQKSGRAVVVGETSAGNVEALLPFCLRDGSQAWIASGVLAPLFGRTWEGVGVVPDIDAPAHEAAPAALSWLLENR